MLETVENHKKTKTKKIPALVEDRLALINVWHGKQDGRFQIYNLTYKCYRRPKPKKQQV